MAALEAMQPWISTIVTLVNVKKSLINVIFDTRQFPGEIAMMPIRKTAMDIDRIVTPTASPPSIVTLPSSATVDQVVEVLRRDGGVIIADMLDQGVLDRFNADLETLPEPRALWRSDLHRRQDPAAARRSLRNRWRRADLLMQPQFLGACEQILADDFSYPHTTGITSVRTTLQVSVTQAIQILARAGCAAAPSR